MIPVRCRPEPATFAARVRRPGLAWLRRQGAAPKDWNGGSAIWRRCLNDLHSEYDGICAYVCFFIEPGTGAKSIDHFIPKSVDPNLAFEWSNYRLACSVINSRKKDRAVPIDPFRLRRETFHLELVTGRIYPNPARSSQLRRKAQCMIDLLRLDDGGWRDVRAKWWKHYLNRGIDQEYLRTHAPFVHAEAARQGML